MNILHVNASAGGGGAERIAVMLTEGLRDAGHRTALLVGHTKSEADHIIEFDRNANASVFESALEKCVKHVLQPLAGRVRGAGLLARLLRQHSNPQRLVDHLRGRETFHYPSTLSSIESLPFVPEVIHCHNLHGGYFDLRALTALSSRTPVFLTLHDEWTFTGHCAYTMGCERWETGCGDCPDLSVYPALMRDGTKGNLARKKSIYSKSRLFVSAPSAWLIERAKRSVLAEGAQDFRVIHNGVDLDIFCPKSKEQCRAKLGIPVDNLVVSFAANSAHTNVFKDYETVVKAGEQLGGLLPSRSVTLLILGGEAGETRSGNVTIKNLGYVNGLEAMAEAYSSADFYLHAANADNFPTTILEALACGVPVVATNVGGIGEQVKNCLTTDGNIDQARLADGTGALVAHKDFQGMARAVERISSTPNVLAQLSANARQDAVKRFDRRRQIDDTLAWYRAFEPAPISS